MMSQMEMFQALEKDFDKNYNISTIVEETATQAVLNANLNDKKVKEIEKFDYNTAEFEEIKSFFAAD